MGLNDQFINTRDHILFMSPLPDLGHAYAMLLQEENMKDFSKQGTTESMAMNVRFQQQASESKSKPQKKSSDASVLCEYCNLTGTFKREVFCSQWIS